MSRAPGGSGARKVSAKVAAAATAKTRIRDPERTRAKILAQATAEFSAKGFNGARVDSIAARCRLSKNTLYYYFGSKEGLFVAVLEGVYERLRQRQSDFSVREVNPVEALRRMVVETFHAFRDHPEAIRLLNEENLHKARHVRRSNRMRQLYDPLVGTIKEVLDRGSAQGVLRPGIDPVRLYLSLSSLAYHFLSNSHTLEIALARDFSSEKAHRDWIDHITDMMLVYCRAPGKTA